MADKPTQRRIRKAEIPEARERFLEHLPRGIPVLTAALLAGFGRDAAYTWREADADFAAAWAAAYAEGSDAIEEEARRRAMDGWDEPVFQGGEQVGVVRRYSDRLLERLLKGRKPELYGEQVAITNQSEPLDMTIRYVHQEAGLGAARARVISAEPNGDTSPTPTPAPSPPALPAPKPPDIEST
jgi:hypothetical protein